MTAPAPGHIDPVTRRGAIRASDKVATMGSCFAQHLARHIAASGLNYYVAEPAPAGMPDEEARGRNFGVFSARYGNVYSVRQALQLFDRAFGLFTPSDAIWMRSDGRFVDAFRPGIEPAGFGAETAVRDAAADHLARVRDVFASCDWLVFTMGLTEAWRSREDGAVYPIAPGVAGGSYVPEKYEFVNFDVEEIATDLKALISKMRSVNKGAKVLLTVSPVPLIATYEKRHVWESTTLSKSRLRVAADLAERELSDVIYFPSYEIITSPAAGSRYYADDLRQVTEAGVKHVMRLFGTHFFESEQDRRNTAPAAFATRGESMSDIVCDEEALEASVRASGMRPGYD